MTRLFRNTTAPADGYSALILFLIAYLGVVGLLVAPKGFLSANTRPAVADRLR